MIIVSNRLPVTAAVTSDQRHRLVPSSGGLATAMREIHAAGDGHWIGWLGESPRIGADGLAQLDADAKALRLLPVRLSASEVSLYYDGYSNGVLWPLFHYLLDKVRLDASHEWRAYVQVNQRFADAIAAVARPGDLIWIHDYQLALVPAMVRQRVASARIGFFLHIPWPSSDVFRILPSRVEVLTGVLGADLIGFQTDSYSQNFLQSAAEVLGIDFHPRSISWEDREVQVGVFPIGIDVRRFSESSPATDAMVSQIRAHTEGKKIVLGVDRLDYTKGVPRRLLAIDRLLEREPRMREQLHFIQIAVPTREKVDAYAELRRTVNELVSRINSHYGSPTGSPVQLLYRNMPHDQLLALYRAADVMLVTPLRDGMNLVAKEYVAARLDGRGVLVLSEFAGAASELATALSVNPYDIDGLAAVIRRAMSMGEDEQRLRMAKMRTAVEAQNVQRWAIEFVTALRGLTPSHVPPIAVERDLEEPVERLLRARHRTVLLDYDGTLVPIAELPAMAAPDRPLLQVLRLLASKGETAVHIVTGRSQESIEPWLGELPIWLHVEHGLRSRRPDGVWLPLARERPAALLDRASAILEQYVLRVRGAFIEPKAASLAFHYRRANPFVIHECMSELRVELEGALGPEGELFEGHKVLEVRLRGISKRGAVELALASAPADTLVLCAGDDRTDEDMFAALPPHSISIHVGKGSSGAALRVAAPEQIRRVLECLAGTGSVVAR